MKRKLSFLLVGLFISVAGYFSYVVFEARSSTTQLVQNAKLQIVEPLSFHDLSESQLKELLEVQDPHFFSHGGTDFTGYQVTTITQSLVKRLYFENFKPGLAKIKQSLIASYALNSLVTKDEQLDLFLNLTYFGESDGTKVIGFGRAAKFYFGKTFGELNRAEYFQLLAMLSSPQLFNLKTHPEKNAEQVALLRKKLSI